MKHNVNMPAIALATYLPEQYPRLLAAAEDSADWDATWEEWHENAQQTKEKLTSMGMNIVEVTLDLDELEKYCQENNLPNNSGTRSEYAAKLLQVQQSQQLVTKEQGVKTITADYAPPVDRLLTYGKPEPADWNDWPNYLELDFTSAHIPDLLRMVTDTELLEIDEEQPEGWSPIHAMRVLGQLRDLSALEPLLSKTEAMLDYKTGIGEWAIEELPDVFGLLGPAAIPMLTAYLADVSHDEYARACCASGLEKIAILHPEAKSECVEILSHQLEVSAEDDYEVNAFIIGHLAQLKAAEALPIIEQAFVAGKVDEGIVGWEDVQVEFGLKEREPRAIEPFFKNLLLGNTGDQSTPKEAVTEHIITPPKVLKGSQPPLKFSGAHNKEKKKKNKKRK